MPAVHFTVQLPGGETKECYSPSTVIREHFKEGDEMPIGEFVTRSRKALGEASERVRMKFGFACSSAASQLAEIEEWSAEYPTDLNIRILRI